jgi:hypothetical protein
MHSNYYFLTKSLNMKRIKILLLLFAFANMFAACKKDKNTEDQLPPATQSGAGTFGCKINGKVFIPKGTNGTGRPNPHIQYDYDLNGQPYLSIEVFQFPTDVNSGIRIGYNFLNTVGFYGLKDSFSFLVSPLPGTMCGGLSSDSLIKVMGGSSITNLNNSSRIISGTFDFKYKKPQCDTVSITDGRFDIKF